MVRQRLVRAGPCRLAPGGYSDGWITLKVLLLPSSVAIRNCPRHDPSVIACLLQPALFQARHINVEIETKGEHTPDKTVADG